ncbi:MAG: sulfatase [Acidobacteriota bacterium]
MPKIARRTLLAGTPFAAALPQTSGGPMNIIHIGVDTWGAHHTGCYGHPEYKTPNVDALIGKSAMFLDAYPQILPTIPARRAIYTGRQIFPSEKIEQPDDTVKIRGWHQLFAEDVTISETLQRSGYTTAFVSDLYHQFKPGKNFTRGFDSWQWIRGQENDRYRTGGRSRIDLAKYTHSSQPQQKGRKAQGIFQYLLNRQDWKKEDDWLSARVFDTAEDWLDDNVTENQPFYLHIESFSPHEYWDPPEDYYRLYMKKDYNGARLIQPPAITNRMSPLEIEHARALYAGLVSFTDSRIGKFLRKVHQLGLMRNSIIVFVADHGTMMGEQNQLHKGETRIREQVTHVPLAIYHPRDNWAGRKIKGYVQHIDLMPTLLDLVGIARPSRVTGESLQPLLVNGGDSRRDWIITGWGEHAAIRTPEWTYLTRWSPGPKFEELYDARQDPLELQNVVASHAKVAADFRARVDRYVEEGWAVTRGTFAIHSV